MPADRSESQDMLARVSRSETETNTAYRKIEDHLRSLARRLDTNERTQSDNSVALNRAANDISVASREQVQAFDTLGSHVISLGERVDRIEQRGSTDPSREMVRGLQDGLTRLADQVAGTANQSASQISVLASAMEAVVTKMSEAHKDAAATATLLTQRMGYLDERVHAMETTLRVKGEATDRALQRLEERANPEFELFAERLLESAEERHAAIRDEFQQNLKSFDQRYGTRREELQHAIDEVRSSGREARNEVRARLAELESRLADVGDKAAVDRLEQSVAQTRASQKDMLDQVQGRIAGLEDRLAATGDTADKAAVDRLAQSIDDTRSSQKDLIDELHAHIAELENRFSQAGETAQKAVTDTLERSVAETRASQKDMVDAVQARIAELEDHFAAVTSEGEQHRAAAEKIQRTIEETRASQQDVLNEVHSRINALEDHLTAEKDAPAKDEASREQLQRLEESIERLTSRVATQEEQSLITLARLEEGFARIESQQDKTMDSRVYGVERGIQELMDRLEAAEKHSLQTSASIEEQLRALSGKIDDANRDTRDAISGLHQSVKDTSGRLEVIEGVAPAPVAFAEPEPELAEPEADIAAVVEAETLQAENEDEEEPVELSAEEESLSARDMPQFDMPPFDEPVAAAFKDSAINRAFGQRHHDAFAPPEDNHDDIFREERPLAADGFAAHQEDSEFVASARHPVMMTSPGLTGEPSATTLGGFTWGAQREEPEARDEQPRSRVGLIGGVALVAILAIGAGVLLSQRLGSHKILQTTPAAQTAPVAVKPAIVKSQAAPVLAPNTIVAPAQKQTPKQAFAPTPEKTGDRLTTLANGGNSKAQLLLGLKYLDGDGIAANDSLAAKWLQRAADQGEPIAQYRLGTLFERGHGVATDATKALHWYEAAARQGNRKAMHNLAVAYAEGAGGAKNYTEAARWFGRAAALGLADSQFNLAVLYERGLGVPQSLTEAYKWYAIAATQGDNESKARVAALATQLTPADHDAAQKAADTFRPEPLNRAANVPPETPGRG